jgi:hypothetical protein
MEVVFYFVQNGTAIVPKYKVDLGYDLLCAKRMMKRKE